MPPLLPRLTLTLGLPDALVIGASAPPVLLRRGLVIGAVAMGALLLSGCGDGASSHSAGEEQHSGGGAAGAGADETTAAIGNPLSNTRANGSLASLPTLDDRMLIAPELLALIDGAVNDVRRSPDYGDAWLALGLLYDANAMGQLAVTAYERAVVLAPNDYRPAYHLARVLERTGQTERAIEIMSDVLSWAPDHAPGQARLGSWLMEAGDLQAARAAYARCLALDPGGLTGTLGLARIAVAMSDGATAVALLEPLRDRHPEVGELRFLLGSAYRLQGRIDEARVELASWDGQPAPFFDPWESEVARRTTGYQALLGQAVDWGRRGEAGRAVEPLERMHAADPADSAVLEKLVAVYIDTGRLGDARQVLAKALQRDPSHYRSWRGLAMVEEAAGDLGSARAAAERCLTLHPTWVPGHELLARIRWRAGDLPGAVLALQDALRYGGPQSSTLRKLARAQGILLRWHDARETLDGALALTPESAEVHALAAEAWAESGGLARAWELLMAGSRLDSNDGEVRRVWQRVAQLDPAGVPQ